jgi:hypothetical protein
MSFANPCAVMDCKRTRTNLKTVIALCTFTECECSVKICRLRSLCAHLQAVIALCIFTVCDRFLHIYSLWSLSAHLLSAIALCHIYSLWSLCAHLQSVIALWKFTVCDRCVNVCRQWSLCVHLQSVIALSKFTLCVRCVHISRLWSHCAHSQSVIALCTFTQISLTIIRTLKSLKYQHSMWLTINPMLDEEKLFRKWTIIFEFLSKTVYKTFQEFHDVWKNISILSNIIICKWWKWLDNHQN